MRNTEPDRNKWRRRVIKIAITLALLLFALNWLSNVFHTYNVAISELNARLSEQSAQLQALDARITHVNSRVTTLQHVVVANMHIAQSEPPTVSIAGKALEAPVVPAPVTAPAIAPLQVTTSITEFVVGSLIFVKQLFLTKGVF